MNNLTALEAAYQVMRGFYGNGAERRKKLESEGYNYKEIQEIVNLIVKYQIEVPVAPAGLPVIDISEHNGGVAWGKVAKQISGAVLRAGWSTQVDKRFTTNYENCVKNGINPDIYYFSYAYNPAQIIKEVNALKLPKDFKGTIYFDWEEASLAYVESVDKNVTIAMMEAMLRQFVSQVSKPALYTNLNMWERYYKNIDWLIRYNIPIWWADWRENTKPSKYASLWQYTNKGKIDGITGDVDLSRRV